MSMSFSRFVKTAMVVAVVGSTALTPLAFAAPVSPVERINVTLEDASLRMATQMLSKQAGLQFVLTPGLDDLPMITLTISNKTPEEAIELICLAAGAYAERLDSGVFVIRKGPKPIEEKVAPVGNKTLAKKEKRIERVKIMRGDPKLIFDLLTKAEIIDSDGSLREVNMFSEEFKRLSASPYAPSQVVMAGGVNIQAPTTSFPVGTNTPLPTDTSRNPVAPNDVVIPGETLNQVGGGRGQGGIGGGPTGGGGGGQPGGGGGGLGGSGGGNVGAPQAGTGFMPEGIDRITYDPTDNSIIVQGDDEAIRKLRSLVAQFDIAPKQVIIKVEFITTSESVDRDFGIDWLYQRGAINAGNQPGSFARTSNPVFINWASGNVASRLRTVLLEGRGKTVNAPLLRTLNNQPAFVQQSTQTTIYIPNTNIGGGGVVTTYTPFQIQANSLLAIKPRINGDGTVTVGLAPQIQDLGQIRRGPDGAEIPDILSQAISVVARVKSGETIALAGFTRKQNASSTQKFPILGDLPIIGQFFRTSTVRNNSQELIIFVTPFIVEDDTIGGLGP